MSTASTFAQEIEKLFPGCVVLTVKQAAQLLGVSSQHVSDLIQEGKIKAFNISGNNPTSREFWRIPVKALADYQEKHCNA